MHVSKVCFHFKQVPSRTGTDIRELRTSCGGFAPPGLHVTFGCLYDLARMTIREEEDFLRLC